MLLLLLDAVERGLHRVGHLDGVRHVRTFDRYYYNTGDSGESMVRRDKSAVGFCWGSPKVRTMSGGYEYIVSQLDGEMRIVLLHRLIAVAEYGFEEVVQNIVHHRNNVPWDNRPKNLGLMGRGEHTRHHRIQIDRQDCRELRQIYKDGGTISDLAERLGFGNTIIWKHLNGECWHHDEKLGPDYDGPRDGPWRDAELFKRLYITEGLTMDQMADQWGCSRATVSNWRAKHSISK